MITALPATPGTFTFGTLFCGYGGTCIGAMQAGGIPVFGVDFNENACAVYAKNIGGHVLCASVLSVDFRRWAGIDLLCISPPCPSFSIANSKGGETETDIAIARAVCRAIREIRPRAIFLENVRGYIKSKSFALVCETLDELGYSYDFDVYDAADYGVPQNRQRLILRALRDLGRDSFMQVPMPSKPQKVKKHTGWYEAIVHRLPYLKETKLARWQTERLLKSGILSVSDSSLLAVNGESMPCRKADEPACTIASDHSPMRHRAILLGDQSGGADGEGCTLREPYQPCNTVDTRLPNLNKAILLSNLHSTSGSVVCDTDEPSPTLTKQTAGERPSHMPHALLVEPNADNDWFKVREGHEPSGTVYKSQNGFQAILCSGALVHDGMTTAWDKDPSLTITNTDKRPERAFILPDGTVSGGRVVALDTLCVAALQTFPPDYQFADKRSYDAEGIGNAVPPLFARAIILSMKEYLTC